MSLLALNDLLSFGPLCLLVAATATGIPPMVRSALRTGGAAVMVGAVVRLNHTRLAAMAFRWSR